jgi:uncharacterized membrane protein YqjE
MHDAPPAEGGILSGVTQMLKTLRQMAENRLELFLVELKEERIRLFDALLLLAAGVLCAFMALLLVTLTVVVIFWDTHRLLVLALLALGYVTLAVAAFMKLRSRLLRWRAFSATLEEFKKDRACLETPN